MLIRFCYKGLHCESGKCKVAIVMLYNFKMVMYLYYNDLLFINKILRT